MKPSPHALVRDATSGQWLQGAGCTGVALADCVENVAAVLREAESALAAGSSCVGFLAYEASAAMDPALVTHRSSALPLAWFATFDELRPVAAPAAAGDADAALDWHPAMSRERYLHALERVRSYLASGDTYQVNFTFPLEAETALPPFDLFCRMTEAQPTAYAAFIETSAFAVCSASPELFLERHGRRLLSRPMKGTARRGLTGREDQGLSERLRASAKERAENVMIVDMVRNDMGRIAEAGSVTVPRLYAVEAYPTVWQMTSDVVCETGASLPDVMHALFPCASITGAPKVRTMQIIRELEAAPRGVYTGTIGFCRPGDHWQFNVAIRTVAIDKQRGVARYGVGSGVVWDSVSDQEYDECLLKAAVLTASPPPFDLLETLLWEPGKGYFLTEEHLGRMQVSAERLGIPFAREQLVLALQAESRRLGPGCHRVRLLLGRDGCTRTESVGLDPAPENPEPWRVAFSREAVSRGDFFLYHKTTHRAVYDAARATVTEVDDVLLWNEEGEVTESTIANLVVRLEGCLVTPPIACGLLGGTFRESLIRDGVVTERILTRDDVRRADQVFLVNSVRRWIPAILVDA